MAVKSESNNFIVLHCETEKGCPIGDIAPDKQATQLIQDYIDVKTHDMRVGAPVMYPDFIKKWGLEDSAGLMHEFQKILDEAVRIERARRERERKK